MVQESVKSLEFEHLHETFCAQLKFQDLVTYFFSIQKRGINSGEIKLLGKHSHPDLCDCDVNVESKFVC